MTKHDEARRAFLLGAAVGAGAVAGATLVPDALAQTHDAPTTGTGPAHSHAGGPGSAHSSTAKTPPPSQHLRNGSCPAQRASRARATRTCSTTSTWRWRAPTPTFSTFYRRGLASL